MREMHFSHNTMPETQSSGSPVTQVRGGTQEHSSTFPFGEPPSFFHRNLGPEAGSHVAEHRQLFWKLVVDASTWPQETENFRPVHSWRGEDPKNLFLFTDYCESSSTDAWLISSHNGKSKMILQKNRQIQTWFPPLASYGLDLKGPLLPKWFYNSMILSPITQS